MKLGAGLGLCGILANHLGAKLVVLTDGDTDTLNFLRENVENNVSSGSSSVKCRQLRWGKEFVESSNWNSFQFDVVLASDVIYVEEMIDPLLDTVVALQDHNGKFLLSYVPRNVSIDKVLESAKLRGLNWRQPNDAKGVYVFERA